MNTIFSAWFQSLGHYIKMSLFLSSPTRLPYSPASIWLTIVTYIVVGELLLGEDRMLMSIIIQIGFEVIILYAISFAVLKLTQKSQRLLQTTSALIGVNLIISATSLLIMSVLSDNGNTEQINAMILNINLLLLLWNLAVISLIFKRAFDIRTVTAGFIALNYFMFYELLLLNFF